MGYINRQHVYYLIKKAKAKMIIAFFVFIMLLSQYETSFEEDDIIKEFECQYDKFDDAYPKSSCQSCLASVKFNNSCFDYFDRDGWLACVGWCDAYEADDECYIQCDDGFIVDKDAGVDLHIRACEVCDTKCQILCGVGGF